MTTSARRPNKSRGARVATAVQSRYTDAYRVAGTINGFGQTFKVAGLVFGAVIFVWAADSLKSPGAGLLAGLVVASIFFVIGVIVAAQGQMLKATIDTAVNSSPFLDNDQKALTMSLIATSVESREAEALPVSGSGKEAETGESLSSPSDSVPTPFCYHCGAEVAEDARICASCGKAL